MVYQGMEISEADNGYVLVVYAGGKFVYTELTELIAKITSLLLENED